MRKAILTASLALAASIASPSLADVGPPAHLRISETEPARFVARWRVPASLPPGAFPVPEFPESCSPADEPAGERQASAWLFTQTWRCADTIAGATIGMRYPFAEFALTTVMRVDLLSGDRFAHLLAPGDPAWRLPEGTASPDRLRAAARSVTAGVTHAVASWVHLLFMLAVALAGGRSLLVRSVTAFSLGQLIGALAPFVPPATAIAPAEIGMAIAAALIAREALRPEGEGRRTVALAAAGGALHGLMLTPILVPVLGGEGIGLATRLGVVLGSDAVHLAGVWLLAAVSSIAARLMSGGRAPGAGGLMKVPGYAAGAGAVALALVLATSGAPVDPAIGSFEPPSSGDREQPAARGGVGSTRVAPAAPETPVQSFFVIEPFEIRHEAMLRLASLAPVLGLSPTGVVEPADQPDLLDRLSSLVLEGMTVTADGSEVAGVIRRADFMMVDPTGAQLRAVATMESVSEAVAGVVVVYPVPGMPLRAEIAWKHFPVAGVEIPVTVIDPESVVSAALSDVAPSLRWENNLAEDPMPSVEAVAVRPVTLPLPLLSLPLFAVAAAILIAAFRGRRAETGFAVARAIVALGLIAGPLANVAVALPGSAGGVPSTEQARRILAGLLPNVYRAMEFRSGEMIYDRLAVSVSGDALTEIYLEQRRTLEMEERGGAQARVETVEVLDAGDISRREEGFAVRSTWTVGGMVTHFGHRHFRQNRYDARLSIAPQDGAWKIGAIEMLDLERLK